MENKTLEYDRLWKTLLRMGLKEEFAAVRMDFFMNIASKGPRIYRKEDLDKIIEESELFKLNSDDVTRVKLFISDEDRFKHYTYENMDKTMLIEYFANTTSDFPEGYFENDGLFDDNTRKTIPPKMDALCTSEMYITDGNIEESDSDSNEVSIPAVITTHLILLTENGREKMTPERYPEVIKHELTHACVFDIFSRYTNNDLHLPIENDTEGTLREDCDYALDTFNILLGNTEDEVNSELFNDILTFYEFVADFLMYEAEGQTKEKNPAPEVNPKKKDVKLRITYRTLTPLDRFEEHIEHNDVDRVKDYEPIIAALRSSYSDYEAFLESVRI